MLQLSSGSSDGDNNGVVLPVHSFSCTARKMPPWAKHSLVTVEYCSNLEKLKHIIGTILEGVRILITSAHVFAHANARVRVQADEPGFV